MSADPLIRNGVTIEPGRFYLAIPTDGPEVPFIVTRDLRGTWCIWGFSIFRRARAYRTLGYNVRTWLDAHPGVVIREDFDRRVVGADSAAEHHKRALAAIVAERDRLRQTLACERGEWAPEGWMWTPHDTWSRYATLGLPGPSASVWRHSDQNGVEWSWRVSKALRGECKTALEAIEAANKAEAADRAAKEG